MTPILVPKFFISTTIPVVYPDNKKPLKAELIKLMDFIQRFSNRFSIKKPRKS
jgi:hypothetical protein